METRIASNHRPRLFKRWRGHTLSYGIGDVARLSTNLAGVDSWCKREQIQILWCVSFYALNALSRLTGVTKSKLRQLSVINGTVV